MAEKMTDRDEEKARPRGDVGKDETGVPPGEQGISNREGDAADDEDEFEEDDDSEDDSEEEQDDTSLG